MFKERLKEIRESKGLSQKELANLTGYTQQAIGKWESLNEKASPNPDTLKDLAKIFDVSIDYLVGNDRPQSNAVFMYKELKEISKAMSIVDGNKRIMMLQTLKSAFPYAFNEYEWALNVIKENNLALYNQLKEGMSELSEDDIIRMAKKIEESE